MFKWLNSRFWNYIAGRILRNRVGLLILVGLFTVFMGFQWKNIHFTQTEANMLPDDNIVNIEYNAFLNKFGEEGNLVVIGVKDHTFFTPKAFNAWDKLMNRRIKSEKAVDLVISINDLKKLAKKRVARKIRISSFCQYKIKPPTILS